MSKQSLSNVPRESAAHTLSAPKKRNMAIVWPIVALVVVVVAAVGIGIFLQSNASNNANSPGGNGMITAPNQQPQGGSGTQRSAHCSGDGPCHMSH
jgi:flagellar basal body-associated protein FliL